MIENSLIIGYNIVTVNIMEIAISTATFFGKSYTEDSLDLIKSLGLKTVEVFLTTFREYEPVFGDLLASRKGDLNVHSVHSLNLHYEPELFNNAERTREDAEAILNKVMSNGAKLGAKYYTFHGIARLKKRPYVVDYDIFARKLERVMAVTAKYGIELSYENVHWALFNTPEFFMNLRSCCPGVKATLDIKQAMQAGLSYKEFLPAVKGRLSTVHICDYDRGGNLTCPGKGSVDFRDLFESLLDIGYDGPVMLELYSNNYENYSELARSIEYLQKILYQINH